MVRAWHGRELAPLARRGVVGMATPELAFYEEFSARENLAFVAATRGLPSADAAVARALAAVGLTPRADDRVGGFSSGMKQRLRLAFAVLHAPPLLLLDEPGSHLDDAGRAVVRALVAEQARERLVLIATNDPEEMTLAGARIELRGRGLGDPA
jgi:heme exporter protein A